MNCRLCSEEAEDQGLCSVCLEIERVRHRQRVIAALNLVDMIVRKTRRLPGGMILVDPVHQDLATCMANKWIETRATEQTDRFHVRVTQTGRKALKLLRGAM